MGDIQENGVSDPEAKWQLGAVGQREPKQCDSPSRPPAAECGR